ncbi:MAG: UDP-glucuronic acid dehydrogenase [Salinicola sp.]|uniref:formyltransferase family protein n=1 Tax=Salinicola sp. TaxID=1978524 RepID=UPI001D9FF0AF|nr:formyltransferase family protein [Salinicola sp.]NRB57876.1 UDP-glucuronic acid dehydrogenase [Salinicola sp.]
MNITLLCSSLSHPVNAWIKRWQSRQQDDHHVVICRDKTELPGGDILFLISCSQIIDAKTRSLYRHVLVLHASDLPYGRGWSPHIWALLDGAKALTVSLLDAEDSVDTGAIWAKRVISVPTHMLYDEVNALLFDTELALMDEAVSLVQTGYTPRPQRDDITPTYYPKRCPADSEIDPELSLSETFNIIRLMDPQRYPAYFRLHGHRYTIELKKVDDDEIN